MCRRIAGSTRDADDAAQEAMIRIVRGLSKFDGRSAFSTWTYRIATNSALDELRRRDRRPQLRRTDPDDDTAEPEHADPLAHRRVDGVVDAVAIDGALAELPDDYRVAVVLRDVADLDYDEIAELLDIPIGTVKSRIARGRSRLADQLDDPGNQHHPTGRPIGGT